MSMVGLSNSGVKDPAPLQTGALAGTLLTLLSIAFRWHAPLASRAYRQGLPYLSVGHTSGTPSEIQHQESAAQIDDREQPPGLRASKSARSEQAPAVTEDWRFVQ